MLFIGAYGMFDHVQLFGDACPSGRPIVLYKGEASIDNFDESAVVACGRLETLDSESRFPIGTESHPKSDAVEESTTVQSTSSAPLSETPPADNATTSVPPQIQREDENKTAGESGNPDVDSLLSLAKSAESLSALRVQQVRIDKTIESGINLSFRRQVWLLRKKRAAAKRAKRRRKSQRRHSIRPRLLWTHLHQHQQQPKHLKLSPVKRKTHFFVNRINIILFMIRFLSKNNNR